MNIERRKVGSVTPEERDVIKALFERKNGLTELSKALVTYNNNKDIANNELYERLVKDMGEVTTTFQAWWNEKSAKYNWENIEGYSWEIDFQTCDIYIRPNKTT